MVSNTTSIHSIGTGTGTRKTLINLISKYYDTLYHTLSIELSNYYFIEPSKITKCLNTCILLIYLLFHSRAVKAMGYCDTIKTRERAIHGYDSFDANITRLEKKLLSEQRVNTSIFYYVMLTDSKEFRRPEYDVGNSSSYNIYFPGHTLLIEKMPRNKFHIYQSYINEYDLPSYMENDIGGKRLWTKKDMNNIINMIKYMCNDNGNLWNAKMTTDWMTLTGVNAIHFEGATINGVYFCFQRFTTKMATHNVYKSIKKVVKNAVVRTKSTPLQLSQLRALQTDLEYYMRLQ